LSRQYLFFIIFKQLIYPDLFSAILLLSISMAIRDYAALILAAGFSSRMGKYKPSLPIGDQTLVGRVISLFLQNNVDIILVTGWRHEELMSVIDASGIEVVVNSDYETGMFTSVLAGLRCIKTTHRGFFVMPVDIPLVRPSTISRLISEAQRHSDKIIYPVFGRLRGHPTLAPCSLRQAITDWGGEDGLKAVLHAREEIAVEIKVADSNILLDVDTPEDYAKLLERFKTYDIPTNEECREILTNICQVEPERRQHCVKVSEVAVMMGRSLQTSGHKLDVELVRAAALLHDIAKGQHEHDIAGGKILREMGFNKVAEIVAVHSDLAGGNTGLSLEDKVVYLADKLVQGENLVSIEERYRSGGRRFGLTPEIEHIIQVRREVALKVQQDIETLLGYPLQQIFPIG
jgi:molybdenum cofactor cytidylyltransferase